MIGHCRYHTGGGQKRDRTSKVNFLELARRCNLDGARGLATLAADGLDLLDDVHTLDNAAENDVLIKKINVKSEKAYFYEPCRPTTRF